MKARHSGKRGDIVMSIPFCKDYGITTLYIPETTGESENLYSDMKPLIEMQGIECYEYPSRLPYTKLAEWPPVDIDLDLQRLNPLRGAIHLAKQYYIRWGVKERDLSKPWLTVTGDPIEKKPYNLINLTPRFREGSTLDWKRVLPTIPEPRFFVGTNEEWEWFCENVGYVQQIWVDGALDLAILVRDADRIYCNQSFVLALAQSMGKEYWLEKKPRKTNCLLYTPNEHILNP